MRVSPLTRQEKDKIWKQVCFGMSSLPQKTAHKSRIVSIFKKSMAITLIFGMTMGTASAANEAKPGDLLFPLDRAMEDAYLFIASNGKKDELKVKFALERVEEVKEIFSEISTKTKIKKAEEELETPPEKVEENTEEKEGLPPPKVETEIDNEDQNLPTGLPTQNGEENEADASPETGVLEITGKAEQEEPSGDDPSVDGEAVVVDDSGEELSPKTGETETEKTKVSSSIWMPIVTLPSRVNFMALPTRL